MHHCNPDELSEQLRRILPGNPGREKMLAGYERMKSKLTLADAPAKAASAILAGLNGKN